MYTNPLYPCLLTYQPIAPLQFGFMLAWGTLCFMPLVHNLQTLHLVAGSHTLPMTWTGAVLWVATAVAMIYLNYDADTQRHRVRDALKKPGVKTSDVIVWGQPVQVIRVPYTDAQGKQHVNQLLVSGWHGVVRHFHYAPDIVLLFLYCAPSGFSAPLTWTYFLYLTSLLLDRCQRIDARCLAKYGPAWEEYVRRVPYKLVSGVF